MTEPTVQLLHDALHDHLHTGLRNGVDTVLARFIFNYGLPPDADIKAIVHAVITSFASLPGEHWLPDDMRESDND